MKGMLMKLTPEKVKTTVKRTETRTDEYPFTHSECLRPLINPISPVDSSPNSI